MSHLCHFETWDRWSIRRDRMQSSDRLRALWMASVLRRRELTVTDTQGFVDELKEPRTK